METLKLYDQPYQAPLSTEKPLTLNKSCTRCDLYQAAQTVCSPGEGRPGGLLVLGEAPTVGESGARRPWSSTTGRYLRTELAKVWQGPIAYGNALGCPSGETTEKQIAACRGYLTKLVEEVQPTRILCFGKWAYFAVMGIPINPMTVRKSYSWLHFQGRDTMVLGLMHPSAALANEFIDTQFKEDLAWACSDSIELEPPPWKDGVVELIQSAKDSLQAIEEIKRSPWFAFDVETAGRFFDDLRLDELGVAPALGDVTFVWNRQVVNDPQIMNPLRDLLCSPEQKSISHFPHEARTCLNLWGTPLESYWFDTGLCFRLLESNASLGLEHLANMVAMGGHKDDAEAVLKKICQRMEKAAAPIQSRLEKRVAAAEFLARGERVPDNFLSQEPFDFAWTEFRKADLEAIASGQQVRQYAYAYLPKTIGAQYVARDAVASKRLAKLYLKRFEKEPDLWRTWEERVRPAVHAVVQMEEWGIQLSRTSIEASRRFLEAQLAQVRIKVEQYGINPRSPTDIERFLFDEIGLRAPKTLPSGHRSTDDESLKLLAGQHPLVDGVIAFRNIDHQLSTYVAPMPTAIHADGRGHFRYNLASTPTNRAGAERIHQMPKASHPDPLTAQIGKMIRNQIVASPGCILLEADWKQLQVYLVAAECNDPKMLAALMSGADIHKQTTTLVGAKLGWDLSTKEKYEEYRRYCKNLVFGVLFGKTKQSFAEELRITEDEAETMMDAMFGEYKGLAAWVKKQRKTASKLGYVWSNFGPHRAMKRDLTDIGSQEFSKRNTAENNSVNHVAQSDEAHVALWAISRVAKRLKEWNNGTKLIMWVHDSFLLDVPEQHIHEAAAMLKEIMEAAPTPGPSGLKLRIDLKQGYSWGNLTDYEPPKKVTPKPEPMGENLEDHTEPWPVIGREPPSGFVDVAEELAVVADTFPRLEAKIGPFAEETPSWLEPDLRAALIAERTARSTPPEVLSDNLVEDWDKPTEAEIKEAAEPDMTEEEFCRMKFFGTPPPFQKCEKCGEKYRVWMYHRSFCTAEVHK